MSSLSFATSSGVVDWVYVQWQVKPMIFRSRIARFLLSLAYAAAIVGGLSWAWGPRGLLAGLALALLLLAWRHDNNVGFLLPLAVLVIITIGVILLLFYLLIIMAH